jgi:hypothetical protein
MNAILTDDYAELVDLLIEARFAAGLTQRALARRIGKVQFHICASKQRQQATPASNASDASSCSISASSPARWILILSICSGAPLPVFMDCEPQPLRP